MKPEFIIVHHSLTEDGQTVSWGAIRKWHTGVTPGSPNRWRDIGYNAGIELIGDHYEVLLGRWWDQEGAHVKELGMNARSLGICLVGNFDLEDPPALQVEVARQLVTRLCASFGVPVERVLGHREVGLLAGLDWQKGEYKSCPGRLFSMLDFRKSLERQ